MKDLLGESLLSYGFISNKPPEHSITALEVIDDKYIVSGGSNGNIIVWRVDKENKVSLIWLLMGHSSSIDILVKLEPEGHLFVSVSRTREMAIWNCDNGHCIKFERGVQYEHKFIMSYVYEAALPALLFCCGKYSGVQVIDSNNLQKRVILQSRVHPNWIQSLCAFRHKQAEVHVVLGLSVSGAVTLWTLENLDNISTDIINSIVYETESKMLQIIHPLTISICPDKPRFVLVLTRDSAQIYDAASWTLLSQISSETESAGFVSGWYLSSSNVLLHMNTGESVLYRVSGNSMSNSGIVGVPSADVSCQTVCGTGEARIVASGTSTGFLRLWNCFCEPANVAKEIVDTSLSRLWTEQRKDSRLGGIHVSAVCFGESGNRLFIGCTLGAIYECNLLDSVCSVLLGNNNKNDSNHQRLLGYHGDSGCAVRALLIMSDPLNTSHFYLWSAGDDFCVRLWIIKETTAKCVRELHNHSNPVSLLIGVSTLSTSSNSGSSGTSSSSSGSSSIKSQQINTKHLPGTEYCISLDINRYEFALFNLQERRGVAKHRFSCAVQRIGWRADQQLLLFGCVDGSVTVWEITSGECTRRESGQLAKDIQDAVGVRLLWSRGAVISWKPNQSEAISLRSLGQIGELLQLDPEPLLLTLTRQKQPLPLLQAELLLSLAFPWKAADDPVLENTLQCTLGLISSASDAGTPGSATTTAAYTISLQLSSDQSSPLAFTNQMLAAMAVCQAINNLPPTILDSEWPRLYHHSNGKNSEKTVKHHADTFASIKQVCCLIATSIATSVLPHTIQTASLHMIHLILHTLILKYQHRCLEIREGACTLLYAALDSLTKKRRQDLIKCWTGDFMIQDVNQFHHQTLQTEQSWIAPLFLAIVASRFDESELGDEHRVARLVCGRLMSWLLLTPGAAGLTAGSAASVHGTTTTSHNQVSGSGGVHGNMEEWPLWRRAAITLLGSGFPVWEPYLEVTTLFHKLLEIAAPANKLLANWSSGQILTNEQDAARCARGALLSVAMARPKVFATTLSIEVLRVQTNQATSGNSSAAMAVAAANSNSATGYPVLGVNSNTMGIIGGPASAAAATGGGGGGGSNSSGSVGTAGNAMGSGTGVIPGSANNSASIPSSQAGTLPTPVTTAASGTATVTTGSQLTQPVLIAARHEVVDVIRVLCERKTREVHEVLPELMDVLIACLNKMELRQYGLQHLFPPIMLFRVAASHTGSGKICVGSRTGYVVFYDVKVGKYSSNPGHKAAVTSVTFSPDGKQVASYSMPDNSVCVWQLSSSGLFGMGSNHTVKLLSTLNVSPVTVSHTVSEEDSGLLLWLEWAESKSLSLVTTAGLINKIKL